MDYKDRVAADLDRWIAAGFVAGEQRQAILDSIPTQRRLDAAAALAWVGAILASIALVAFVSANWALLPRLVQFAMVLTLYLAGAGGGAWALRHKRPILANGLLTFAAVAFAAAIGLTGQIFDIAGDTRTACYATAISAAGLALAARASGPAVVAMVFLGIGDFMTHDLFSSHWSYDTPWLLVGAPLAAVLAVRWKSTPLAHGASLGLIGVAIWLAGKIADHEVAFYLLSLVAAAGAAAARWAREQGFRDGGVIYGWLVWAAFGLFIAGGIDHAGHNVVHRLIWLALAGAAVAIGRLDRHALVTAAGVLSLLASIFALLVDLGVDLMTSALVFFLAAVAAGFAGWALRRKAPA